jgi:hypothetical protein
MMLIGSPANSRIITPVDGHGGGDFGDVQVAVGLQDKVAQGEGVIDQVVPLGVGHPGGVQQDGDLVVEFEQFVTLIPNTSALLATFQSWASIRECRASCSGASAS